MRALLIALALVLPAAEAGAGAWPRPKGETFLSFSQQVSTGARTLIDATQDIRSYASVYAEYGLTDRLTIGLDAGTGAGEDDRVGAALVFARLPVWSPGAHRVAIDFGIGTLQSEAQGRQTRFRPGLAWGRGFESRWGGGWLGMESSLELREPSGDVAVKADFTAGLKPNDRWMLIAQAQTGYYPDAGGIVRLAPSVVRRLGPRSHLQLGALAEVAGTTPSASAAPSGSPSEPPPAARRSPAAPAPPANRPVTSRTAIFSTRTTPLDGPAEVEPDMGIERAGRPRPGRPRAAPPARSPPEAPAPCNGRRRGRAARPSSAPAPPAPAPRPARRRSAPAPAARAAPSPARRPR